VKAYLKDWISVSRFGDPSMVYCLKNYGPKAVHRPLKEETLNNKPAEFRIDHPTGKPLLDDRPGVLNRSERA